MISSLCMSSIQLCSLVITPQQWHTLTDEGLYERAILKLEGFMQEGHMQAWVCLVSTNAGAGGRYHHQGSRLALGDQ